MSKYRTHKEYLDKALKDPKEASLYLNAALEENDPALILAALTQVVRAHYPGPAFIKRFQSTATPN